MNPQYLPPQQFGGPQVYPSSRSSPGTLPQSGQNFQNIPLGPSKPGLPPMSVGGPPPTSNAGQFPPPRSIPSGQLPPSQDPTSFNSENASLNFTNGAQQFQNGFPAVSQASRPPLMPGNLQRPPSNQPPVSHSESMPPQNQLGPLLTSQGPTGMPPQNSQLRDSSPHSVQNQQHPNVSTPSGVPQHHAPPTSQSQGPPSMDKTQSPQGQNRPPSAGLPAGQIQGPPVGQPPYGNQSKPGDPPQLGQNAKGPTQQPFGGPPVNQNEPSLTGPPTGQNHPTNGPPTSQNQPFGVYNQNQNQPMQQAPMGPNQPPMGQNLPPMGQNQPPMNQFSPPGPLNAMSGSMQGSMVGAPKPFQPPVPGPPMPGQLIQGPGSMPGQSMQGPGSMPPMPGQHMQGPGSMPPMPGQHMQGPGSVPGQGHMPPMQGQPPMPGQPSMPGQSQYGQGSVQRGQQMRPPMPGQYNPSQITNQMQGMSLGGQQRYPGMQATKPPINGEMGPPHMPPAGAQSRGPPPGPGYPPMPGQGPMGGQQGPPGPMGGPQGPMGGYPPQQGGYMQQQQQQQQARRLDPDQMPSPIQVTQDDQQTRSGVFVTNQTGLVPPLVTTNFVVQDQGNASPRFIRSTMYNIPINQDIIKQTAVPFSLVISPMARTIEDEYPPPIVNFGELGPVRCVRCKAYMCPYMQFIDSGRRFQCLFCKATTDLPTEYFQHLDHTGQRIDRFERPELILGAYEFVATADYCRNNVLPKPPAVIFIIDVSYNSVKSGLVHLLCSQMKEIIQNLPVDQGHEKSNMKVGFITYNSSVHFYNIKGTLAAPQMLVVGDVQEMFMPLLDGFLSTPEESEAIIDALMEQIPSMFADTRETETVLLPAIQAGLEALKASECAGKLLVFHTTLPTAEAPGKLKNRDDRKLLGTDKEKTILTPQTQAYNQLGQDCVAAGCSVDLFVVNNSYIDVATVGQVSRLTGGEVFKYTYFQADLDGDRLVNDVVMDINRPIAFDAIMRVRTSTGVRPTDFYGHFYMSNTTDMELAAIDCDKAVGIEIKHDDKLTEEENVYVQAALLYTSCSGQRRLRILNLSFKSCSQMADLYRSCELDTLINYISKQAVYKLLDSNPKAVKEAIVSRSAQILAAYRKNCASPSSAGQLILPECMKLLPLYVNCLLRSDALSGGSDMTVDDRSFVMMAVMTMDVPSSLNYFYPRLMPLHDLEPPTGDGPVTIPAPIRCTYEKIGDQGVYLLENGIHMFLWFGLGVNPEFIQKLFGAPSAIQVNLEAGLPELENPLNIAVRSIIEEVRIQRHRCMRLTLVRQREKLEPVFKHFLAEDRGTDGSPSYVDFLCHLHKEIRALLS
ncbi:unnamed protein product [Acanthoscelides obtectus]|uniref:Protein transport protein Sec24C n=2 Tax=Acanthoscelides obtectus TaxID=200917 RepID=A0A9P0LCE9_ACAOB|nr:unnamed protein product [Acanthoscelides obtectus]CAK1675946.1 Protein transport protein Sec24C [Acanthoscelides obtectus]